MAAPKDNAELQFSTCSKFGEFWGMFKPPKCGQSGGIKMRTIPTDTIGPRRTLSCSGPNNNQKDFF